tara:strand:+ start:447 stop:713 length:267 start_codon:yes stop_codon:yes gene_type:complete
MNPNTHITIVALIILFANSVFAYWCINRFAEYKHMFREFNKDLYKQEKQISSNLNNIKWLMTKVEEIVELQEELIKSYENLKEDKDGS